MILDGSILVATIMYYLIAQFKINEAYSSGYHGIWTYFTFVHIAMLVFQTLLLLCDYKNRKTWVLSLRSGAFAFVLGNALIVTFLGLLSVWLIAFFTFVQGAHALLFFRGLKMKNDAYMFYGSMENQIQYRRAPLESSASVAGGNNPN